MTKETIREKWNEEWEFIHWNHARSRGEKVVNPFLRGLNWIAKGLIFLSAILFVTCGYRSAREKEALSRMDAPCAILGRTQLYVSHDRIYLFSEAESAANIYDTDGTFLFRVQAPHFSNGMGSMALFGEEIYITSRMDQLVRFDRDGNYLGIAESVQEHNKREREENLQSTYDSQVYDVDGDPRISFGRTFYTTAIYFDENGVWYRDWIEEEGEHVYYYYFYQDDSGTYRLEGSQDRNNAQQIRLLGGNTAEYGAPATDGKATYSVSGGGLYKTENGQRERLI